MTPILFVRDLKLSYPSNDNKHTALNGISFDLFKNESLGIVGESGSGKTSLASAIMQLFPHGTSPTLDGMIVFSAQNLLNLNQIQMQQIRGKEIAMVFQEPLLALNPIRTIGDQFSEILIWHLGHPKKEAKLKVLDLLKQVGIQDPHSCYSQYPHMLSSGMRQRAMIAMAIALNPKVLICDEPTSSLDTTVQQEILSLLQELKNKHQMTIIFITHDLRVVRSICQRVLILKDGQIVEQGLVDKILTEPTSEYGKLLIASELKINPAEKILNKEILSAHNLFQKIDHRIILDDISLRVHSGECLGVMGESGTGKTTLGRCLLRLLKPSSGKVLYKKAEIFNLKKSELLSLRNKMQYIFQDPAHAFDPLYTIGDALKEPMLLHKICLSEAEAITKITFYFELASLDLNLLKRYPHQVSAGQKQRINIIRSLLIDPEFLILDEPVSALDMVTQKQILDLIKLLITTNDKSCILISHDPSVIAYMCQRVIILHQGKIIEEGKVQRIFTTPEHPISRQLISSWRANDL